MIEFDENGSVNSIEETPAKPKSYYAITGLYFFDNDVIDIASKVKPSKRGELEITDVINAYQERKDLKVELLGRGFAWLDTGTHDSLIDAGQFVKTVEERQGYKIACLEEIAFKSGWLSKEKLIEKGESMPGSKYGHYLLELVGFSEFN